MENDDFFKMIDFEKINEYIKKNSDRRIRFVSFCIGLILGALAPDLEIQFDPLNVETLIGLVVGFVWTFSRYKKYGNSGVFKAQNELALFFTYLVNFIFGGVTGFYAVRTIVLYIFG